VEELADRYGNAWAGAEEDFRERNEAGGRARARPSRAVSGVPEDRGAAVR